VTRTALLCLLAAAAAAAPALAHAQPQIELPPEPPAPATALPRETGIEVPLAQAPAMQGTAIGGYGEITYNNLQGVPPVVDVRRLVLYVGHNFSDRLRFCSELEVEHAVSSAADQGEFEVEQAYLDGLFTPHLNLRGGLVIMPVGIVNVYHEPPTFNGVDRPDVDTLVIPSTWREPGLGLFGEIMPALRYQLYLVNGLNANGFTAESAIREGHQEGQLARADDFGGVARVDYEPRLGTVAGASAYYATSGNSLRDTVGRVAVTLLEADARTRLGAFTARAELAVLFIGDAAALDGALAAAATAAGQPAPAPVSARSQGAYIEAGYDIMRLIRPASAQGITLFGRFDYADTQAAVPAGFTADPALRRYTYTLGTSYHPLPEIALKLDLRRHEYGAGPGRNEIAAAITWMF
jgi:hypothetical protein